MSDDRWGGGSDQDPFDELDDEFGSVRFADDRPAGGGVVDGTGPDGTTAATSGLSFGGEETSLPHWTDPPSRENPRTPGRRSEESWGSYPGDDEDDPYLGEEPMPRGRPARGARGGRGPRREPDPTGGTDSMPMPRGPRGPRPGAARGPRGARPAPRRGEFDVEPESLDARMGRDMPTAVGVGLGIAAVFLLIDVFGKAWMVAAFVAIVMVLGSLEFFSKTSERGYRPVTVVGSVAIGLTPLAGYAFGAEGVVLGLTFALVASSIVFMSSPGVASGPLPNMAITNLGVVYLGLLGSFGGLILGAPGNIGTDTMLMLAVGVVAADVGGLFVGSSVGRTPLREWISPSKTLEGMVGGVIASIIAVSIFSIGNGTWNGKLNVLVLGLGIGIFAPLGDLTESMFKRNLDIKDFGTLIKGHGGVLDRFDGFLFALPFVYYALIVLEPWTKTG
ncbi:MAG: putative phosphatidate cytidylyltransferase [Actinomycetota bacterium]